MEDYKASTKVINSFVNLLTLTRFIDGLNEEISMHVRSCRPETLEHAYEITQQYSNAAYRHKLDRKTNHPTPHIKQQNGEQNKPNTSSAYPRYSDKTPSGKFKNRQQTDGDVSMRTHISKMQVNNHNQKEKEFETNADDEPEYNTTIEAAENSKLDSDDDDYLISEEINFQLALEKNQGR